MGDLVAAGARSRSRRAWAWWRGLAASDRRAVAAALLVFVAAPFARPVWTILGPETAAAVAFKQAMGFERWYWLAEGFARRVIAPRVLRAQRAATSSAST